MQYLAGGLGIVAMILGVALKIEVMRYDALDKEYQGFKAKVEVLGREAQKAADEKYAKAIKDREKANAENIATTARLNDAVAKLRAQRSSRNFLPSPAATASRPDVASFDRTELERALRVFDQDLQGFTNEGSKAVIDLDTAKEWARQLQ